MVSHLIDSIPDRNTVFDGWNDDPVRFVMGTPPELGPLLAEQPPPGAAGVLPFCVQGGHIFLLLGREAPRQNFQGAGTWCDFGGGVHGKKTSMQVATQELQEETFGSIMDDIHRLQAFVENNLRMFVCSNVGRKTPYHMYVVQVPYCDIPSVFRWRLRVARKYRNCDNTCQSAERARLQREQPHGFQMNGKIRKAWLEKDDIQWVSVDKLHQFPLRWEFLDTIRRDNIVGNLKSRMVDQSNSSHFGGRNEIQ